MCTFEKGRSFLVSDMLLPINALPLNMIWIDPGSFIMGGVPGVHWFPVEEQPFIAKVDKGFWISQYLLTQAQWYSIMGYNPSYFQDDAQNNPVEMVSWNDVTLFCESMNRKLNINSDSEYYFWLPTEIQWEYTCRAGTRMKYPNGNTESDIDQIAWYKKNSNNQTHRVGIKDPNSWGLYDVLGNVYEWCANSPEKYPIDTNNSLYNYPPLGVRAFRSASFADSLDHDKFRCSARDGLEDDFRDNRLGCRICLTYRD